MALLSTLARQGRKLKKLLKKPTEGQKQIEPVTREQRAYAKGQLKAVAATGAVALTHAALAKKDIKELEQLLKKETDEKNRLKLREAINEKVREAI